MGYFSILLCRKEPIRTFYSECVEYWHDRNSPFGIRTRDPYKDRIVYAPQNSIRQKKFDEICQNQWEQDDADKK